MNPSEKKGPARVLPIKRLTPVRVSEADLVRESHLRPNDPLPLVLEPKVASVDLLEWVTSHRDRLLTLLREHGGILFRGFSVDSANKFANVASALTPKLLDYVERAAARTQVAPKVFTSTELASDQWIPHHHEMSYSHNWPWRIYFFCDLPAQEGGGTPIANERRFYPQLDAAIKKRFIERKVMYVRNYSQQLDLPWQEAFQSLDRADVERYCRRWGTEFEWLDADRLRTRQIRQAIVTHPETGETVWFNHAHLFHESNLEPTIREVLLSTYGNEGLPRNAFYGDGSIIETSVLDDIRANYKDCSVTFSWRKGDILLLDNFLSAHGREPYKGERRILVSMADLYVNQELKQ